MADRGEDQEAAEHPNGTANERLATTKVLDHVQTNKGDGKVDGVEDDLGDEGVDLHRFEDGRAVVEEVVGAGKLLEHLQSHAESDTISHARGLEHADELLDRASLDLVFGAELALNLHDLGVDGPVVFCGSVHTADGLLGSFFVTMSEIVSRGLGEKQDAKAQDQSPDPAQANDDPPTG